MRLASILGSLASINIVIAFAYQWYIVTILGPGAETDALFAGMMIPQLILAVVSSSLTHVLVPLLATKNGEDFYKQAWTFFQGIGVLFSSIAVLLFVSAPWWVPLTVPGFDANMKSLTLSLTRIQLLGMVFIALTSVLWSVCHAQQKFIWVEVSAILANIVGFVFLFCGLLHLDVKVAAWAMVVKSVLQVILLVPIMGPYLIPDLSSSSIKEAWSRLRPLLLGTSYYKTEQFLDRFLVSMAPIGQLSLLNLAQQIYAAGNQILDKAVAAPMVPVLAQLANNEDWSSFGKVVRKRLLWVTGITIFGFLILFSIGKLILKLLFQYNSFDSTDTYMLWLILIAFIGIWIGGAIGQILSTAFYSQGETRIPTRIGVFGYTLGLIFKVIGFYMWGVIGIAVGTSLYYFINVFLLQFLLFKRVRQRILEKK